MAGKQKSKGGMSNGAVIVALWDATGILHEWSHGEDDLGNEA